MRERERERDGCDLTIVVLKLAMSLHFPLPKICILVRPLPNGTEFTLSVAKKSHSVCKNYTLQSASLMWRVK